MNDQPYSKSPLVEAILDIQVELSPDFPFESLSKCQRPVKSDYPNRRERQKFTGEFVFGPGASSSSSASTLSEGYIFASADNRKLFQASRRGFAFNHLAPYPGWQTFSDEAKRLWDVYRKTTHPLGYKRVAVRYINRVDFANSPVALEKFFRSHPQVSPDLPQEMGHFFYQVSLALLEIQSTVIVTLTPVKPEIPGGVSIVLDLDLFRTEGMPSGKELWAVFDSFRVWKNKVFEACITNDARELIR